MIVGTGVDIVEVRRIAASITRFGDRFLQRVFTPQEIRYCAEKLNRFERFAARFAAKEAGFKAIGTGIARGVSWQEIEVQREPGGRPTIVFTGRALEHARSLGVRRAALSMSHTAEQAIAQVILED